MYFSLHLKHLSFLLDFNDILLIFTDFVKIFKFQLSGKSAQLGAEFHVHGRTDTQTDETQSQFS